MADLPEIQIKACLKCGDQLSPRRQPIGYCTYCEAIIKGEKEKAEAESFGRALTDVHKRM